jgi:membrane-associated protein
VPSLVSAVSALGPEWLQPDSILERFGTWALVAVLVILFVECGLLIFFLPGDSLLFVTGLFIATGAIQTPLWLALLLMSIAAVAGNLVGYWVGRKAGPPLFERPNSRLIKPKHVAKTHEFFEKYGARSIILARFVPIVRTFITALAGIARMDYRRYARYSAIGGVAWVVAVTLLGYFLGNRFPAIEDNIELIAVIIVVISVVPIGLELLKARRERTSLAEAVEESLAPESDTS